MNDSSLSTLLRNSNPWWKNPSSPLKTLDGDTVLNEIAKMPFQYNAELLQDIRPPNLYIVTGPRRVGKSVEMKQTIKRLLSQGIPARSIVTCSCDGFSTQDLRRLFTVGRNICQPDENGHIWWLLDEISAVRGDWSAIIKGERDSFSKQDCIVLTGSSAKNLREATKNLAGRRGEVKHSDRILLPLGFRRFCKLTNIDLPELPSCSINQLWSLEIQECLANMQYWIEELVAAWEAYCRVGGFPQAIADYIRFGDVSEGFVRDLWDVIRGEIILSDTLSDHDILMLMVNITASIATPLNASNIASKVESMNYKRVNDRIAELVQNYLAWKCPQLGSSKPNFKAPRKVYFTDPLLSRLPSLIDNQYHEIDTSKITEQQIGMSLIQAIERQTPGIFNYESRLQYQRTPTGREIDFVGPDFQGKCLESKYVDKGWKQESQTAKAHYSQAILATRRVYDKSTSAWALPAPFIAYLLDSDTPYLNLY
jgi:predicted AAA+ superfamily ATPase